MMKLLYTIFIFLFTFQLKAQDQDITNILFIGNSITYYNDMPQIVKNIANSKGDPTEVTMYAPGGTGFVNHVQDNNVYNHFRESKWDYVVLQPGSGESGGVSQTKEQTLLRAKKLNDSIKKYNPCAQILYYQISNGVWGNTSDNLATYNSSMDNIKTNVDFWADNTSTFYAPAGEAMRTAWNNDTNTMLWGNTGDIHPNVKGSYLIACTIYASIFQKPSLGTDVNVNGVTDDEATNYQSIADGIVLNNLSDWNINVYNQHADFSYQINGNEVTFNNLSANSTSYEWSFGDGTISTEENPVHQYTENGVYEVTLTSFNQTCEKRVSKQVSFNLSIDEALASEIVVYPNPFHDKIVIEKASVINAIKMYNAIGQKILFQLKKITTGKYEISTKGLSKGMYFLEMNGKTIKLIKK